MKYGQKLNLVDAHVTPRNIQEVQASKLGDALGIPSSSTKYQVIFHLLYFYCFICYVMFLERLRFLFSVFCFILLCFVLSNKFLDYSILVWERDTLRCIASYFTLE